MDQVHVIRYKVLVEGHSIRAVACQMGISRNTVSKYLKVSEPKRIVSQPKPSPVMETVAQPGFYALPPMQSISVRSLGAVTRLYVAHQVC
jgi:hypothetical protein